MKKETLEEAAKENFKGEYVCNGIDIVPAWRQGFVVGAKWKQERMYSEEEVLQILFRFTNRFDLKKNIEITAEMQKEWFEQFKH